MENWVRKNLFPLGEFLIFVIEQKPLQLIRSFCIKSSERLNGWVHMVWDLGCRSHRSFVNNNYSLGCRRHSI